MGNTGRKFPCTSTYCKYVGAGRTAVGSGPLANYHSTECSLLITTTVAFRSHSTDELAQTTTTPSTSVVTTIYYLGKTKTSPFGDTFG